MDDNSIRAPEAEKQSYSEAQLRLLIEAVADGLWDWDIRSGNTYMSPRYWEMTGYRAEETRTDLESFRRLVHPQDWPSVQQAINEHLAGKSPQSVSEYRMITKDGQEKWILGRGKIIERGPDGAPWRMVGTVSDITERKRMEMEMGESKEKFAKAFHSTPIGMTLSTREEGRYLDVNDAFLDLLQRTREEVIGRTAVEVGAWRDTEQRAAFLAKLKGAGRAHHVEVKWQTKSGQIRDVMMSGDEVLIGGVNCLLGSVVDISERKRAEEKLRASEEFKAAIFNSVASQIAVLDRHGVIVAVNASWERFALDNSPRDGGELARKVGVGVNYLEVCRASFGKQAEGTRTAHEGILAVIEGRLASFSIEYPCHSPDEPRWFSMSVTPLGKENAVVVSHTNITERKLMDQALRVREEQLRLYAEAKPFGCGLARP